MGFTSPAPTSTRATRWHSATISGRLDGRRGGTPSVTDITQYPRGGTAMAQNDDRATAPGASEDAKAKFREALDRKKATQHRTTDGSTNTGSVHGSETAGPVQRQFRRKSGSA